jgi:hypothetical protein
LITTSEAAGLAEAGKENASRENRMRKVSKRDMRRLLFGFAAVDFYHDSISWGSSRRRRGERWVNKYRDAIRVYNIFVEIEMNTQESVCLSILKQSGCD